MTNHAPDDTLADPDFDTSKRYVQVTARRPDGFVEFNFAVGEPGLFVELVLPEADLAAFCAANDAELLVPDTDTHDPAEPDATTWRLRDATRHP